MLSSHKKDTPFRGNNSFSFALPLSLFLFFLCIRCYIIMKKVGGHTIKLIAAVVVVVTAAVYTH
jgi:4-amino-4-deoxy-L-arabinose transferase-like glycosyltransferase